MILKELVCDTDENTVSNGAGWTLGTPWTAGFSNTAPNTENILNNKYLQS